MRILVIGGTGFIGEYLCRALAAGADSIVVIHASELLSEEKISGVRYQPIDLTTNFLDLKKILAEVEAIVWAVQPDVLRMKHIISVISSFNNIKKIVYLSTLLVYSDSPFRQDESAILDPKTDYEKMKNEEEILLGEYVEKTNSSLCIARLGNVYGDVKNKGVVNGVLFSLFNETAFYLDGGGTNLRDFIFVEDVARLLAGLIKIDSVFQTEKFNVCTGEGHSIINLISMVEEITGKKLKISNANIFEESKNVIGDNQKIVETLKLRPRYNLTEGLIKTYNNYLNHYEFKHD